MNIFMLSDGSILIYSFKFWCVGHKLKGGRKKWISFHNSCHFCSEQQYLILYLRAVPWQHEKASLKKKAHSPKLSMCTLQQKLCKSQAATGKNLGEQSAFLCQLDPS